MLTILKEKKSANSQTCSVNLEMKWYGSMKMNNDTKLDFTVSTMLIHSCIWLTKIKDVKDDASIREAVKETVNMKSMTIIIMEDEGAISEMEKLLMLFFSTAL